MLTPKIKIFPIKGQGKVLWFLFLSVITAVNTKGKFFKVKNPHPDQYWNPKIIEVQSRRDHCKKYSRCCNRLNNWLKGMKIKQSNQIKDFQHKLSWKTVGNTKANTLIVGDLNVKNMAKSKVKGLDRSIQNTRRKPSKILGVERNTVS